MSNKIYKAIGLMSGTSLDGHIDVALIETDGQGYVNALGFYAHPYDRSVRDAVRSCFGKREGDEQTRAAEDLVTDVHIEAVKASGFRADMVGFHGQTITHDPERGFTWQLGDGARMAKALGMSVVNDFRTADMRAGGQGAPLAPLFHQAIFSGHEKPLVVLNLGGVANVTYLGEDSELIAFDTGPANAIMDDVMRIYGGADYDANGVVASTGQADLKAIEDFLAHPYFAQKPPKSLDRDAFKNVMDSLPPALPDAMATLAMMSCDSILKALEHFPVMPKRWYVCGGGRHNHFIMNTLSGMLDNADVLNIDGAGWDGDAIEAQCFGYLAVRSLYKLPLSQPSTTGVSEAITGGVMHQP